ncbi:hypothetical protein FB451DRAFT_1185013 [Mycena latifolia]|nr:hypothetical protein FB451DRAFT_1185013 [Mycena latifolia]
MHGHRLPEFDTFDGLQVSGSKDQRKAMSKVEWTEKNTMQQGGAWGMPRSHAKPIHDRAASIVREGPDDKTALVVWCNKCTSCEQRVIGCIDKAQRSFNNHKQIDLIVDNKYNGVYGPEQMQGGGIKPCLYQFKGIFTHNKADSTELLPQGEQSTQSNQPTSWDFTVFNQLQYDSYLRTIRIEARTVRSLSLNSLTPTRLLHLEIFTLPADIHGSTGICSTRYYVA